MKCKPYELRVIWNISQEYVLAVRVRALNVGKVGLSAWMHTALTPHRVNLLCLGLLI